MANIHGTAVVVGRFGVLVLGPSGSGKTTLALELVRRAEGQGLFAAFVADDQLFPEPSAGRLVVAAPAGIAGLAEVHGLGPVPVPGIGTAVIDLVVELVEGSPRYQELVTRLVEGVGLPVVALPQRHVLQAAPVVFAHLRLGTFAGMRQNG